MQWWSDPAAGDIVWCHFPDNIHPKPKPRPGIVLATLQNEQAHWFVRVAYGTSQKTSQLYAGEFLLSRADHPAPYALAGLSYDTKFDLSKVLELPFNADYFSVPPHAPHGQTPKLGTLHPSMVRIAAAAFSAVKQ